MAKARLNNQSLLTPELKADLTKLQGDIELSEQRLDLLAELGLGVETYRQRLEADKRRVKLLLEKG